MKKKVIAVMLVTGLTIATVASANWGRHGDWDGNCGNFRGRQVMMNPQVDDVTKAKIHQFFKDNQPLQKEIAMKRAEKMALMRSETPDPTAVAKVTGELFDLHTSLRTKAETAGVDEYLGPPMRAGKGRGHHSGRGQGPGFGKRNCQ